MRSGRPLSGTVRVSGMTKNAGLKQMAAALLAPGTTTIRNVARVSDLDIMIDVLRAMGAQVDWMGPDTLQLDTAGTLRPEAPYELVTRLRASINVLAPLVARFGHARVAMPGGDDIGNRRLDLHFAGLTAMGVEIEIVHGFIEARSDGLVGARVVLDYPSVGATEQVLTAAVLAKGETVIENAAREPEITALGAFLDRMGAHVIGAGSSTIHVDGVEELVPVETELPGDRIEAGTLLIACGMAGGEIEVEGIRYDDLEIVARKLGEMGMKISPTINGLWAYARDRLQAVDVATLPFPGFATDFMPPIVSLLTVSEGTGIVTENVFDNRFAFCHELKRMGADIRTEGRHVIVRGVPRLSGAPVRATDVRAGAAVVLAGLGADGETTVLDPHHIDRGYADLPAKLAALGADIQRAAD